MPRGLSLSSMDTHMECASNSTDLLFHVLNVPLHMPKLCGDFARLLQTCRTASHPGRCVVDHYALGWAEEHETLFVQHLRCWHISANAHHNIIVRVSMDKASQSNKTNLRQSITIRASSDSAWMCSTTTHRLPVELIHATLRLLMP